MPPIQSIQQGLLSCPQLTVIQQDTDDKGLEELKLQVSWYLTVSKDYGSKGATSVSRQDPR